MSNKCLYTLDAYKRERSEKLATVLAIVLALGPWWSQRASNLQVGTMGIVFDVRTLLNIHNNPTAQLSLRAPKGGDEHCYINHNFYSVLASHGTTIQHREGKRSRGRY